MLSSEDIATIVKKAFNNEVVKVLEYRLHSHSKDRTGYLGEHENLEITIQKSNSLEPETHRFFVKSKPNLSERQLKFINDNDLFKQEATFFNTALAYLSNNFIGDNWYPECFLANDNVIVLEDMRNKGYSMKTDKIFQGDYLKSAVKAQARLHAASILAEARLGKLLGDICPEACVEHLFVDRVLKGKRIDLYSNLCEQIANRLQRDHRRIKTALTKGFLHLYLPESRNKSNCVICHGDTWPNNYLFDSNNPPKCVMVDFQLTRYAPRMYDVVQFIYLSTTRELRKKEEHETIKAYHEELCKTLAENNPSLERPSLQDILEEYEDVRLSAMLAAVVYYPIIGVAETCLSKEDNMDDFYQKVMLRTSNDFVMEIYDRQAEFAKRISEIVLEIIDYSEKLGIPTYEENGELCKTD